MIIILDKMRDILKGETGVPTTILTNNMQPKPDEMIGLFSYMGAPPSHTFGNGHGYGDLIESFMVQVRSRAADMDDAEAALIAAASALENYVGDDIIIARKSSIIPIGQDQGNPPRWEFTVNFEVTPKG